MVSKICSLVAVLFFCTQIQAQETTPTKAIRSKTVFSLEKPLNIGLTGFHPDVIEITPTRGNQFRVFFTIKDHYREPIAGSTSGRRTDVVGTAVRIGQSNQFSFSVNHSEKNGPWVNPGYSSTQFEGKFDLDSNTISVDSGESKANFPSRRDPYQAHGYTEPTKYESKLPGNSSRIAASYTERQAKKIFTQDCLAAIRRPR